MDKLTAGDAACGDNFGDAVAIDGAYAIVGALFDDNEGGADAGAAYVFWRDNNGTPDNRTDDTWVEQDKLMASDAAPGDYFGNSVAINGDYAVVGAPGDDSERGSAYIFHRDDNGTPADPTDDTWIEEAKLTSSNGDSGDRFGGGLGVSISGSYVVVGAFRNDHAGVWSGAAYIFEKPVNGWGNTTETAKLTASDAEAYDYFGFAVGISGDYVVVGAPQYDADPGSAYVFERPPGGWVDMTETQKLPNCVSEPNDKFGTAVSISGDCAVVGSPWDGHAGPQSGSACVFCRCNGTWEQKAKLTASDAAQGDHFGHFISIDGNYVVVGASGHDGFSGAAYLFWRDDPGTPADPCDDAWIPGDKITPSDPAPNDVFGHGVSVSGDYALVGAFRNDDASPEYPNCNSGSAYVFLIAGPDCNENAEPDTCDILAGTAADKNANGVPDECERVYLDVKPGSCPNPLNRDSHGVLPVALPGTADFDATTIDVASVRLSRADGVGGDVAPNEGPPGPHSVFEDVATPFDGEWCDCHDLTGDGFVDLMMHFRTDDVVAALQLNELPAGDLVELVVSGNLLDGTPFTSAGDCIRLVPPGMPGTNVLFSSTVGGAFIDASPLDLLLDSGGFGTFQRTYFDGSLVTVTAETETYLPRRPFAGWKVNGAMESANATHQILLNGDTTVQAVYETAVTPTPMPRPTAPRPAAEADPVGPIEPR